MDLTAYCTVDGASHFVLGLHSNFDGCVDPFEINMETIVCGDLNRPEAFRKYPHYWLAGDELKAGRALGRRDPRERVGPLTKIDEIYASAETRSDI